MSVSLSDISKRIASENHFNGILVAAVVDQVSQIIHDELLKGNTVRLPFGRFMVMENRYKGAGLINSSSSLHDYRPVFRFSQKFKSEMGRVKSEELRVKS